MIRYLLLALLFFMFVSDPLNLNTSLAPGLSVKNALLYLIFLMLAIETAVVRERKLELLPVFAPFFAYVLYAVFSWVLILLIIKYPHYDPLRTLIPLKAGPVEHLMVLLVFFYGIRDSQQALWLLTNFVWLIIFSNAITVVDALNIPDLGIIYEDKRGHVGGLIGNPNEFAAFLVLFLPTIVVIYSKAMGFKKWLAGAGVAVSSLVFLLALSRGAFVGLVLGGIVSAIFLRAHIPAHRIVRVGIWSVVLSLALVVIGFAVGYGDLMIDRFQESQTGNKFEATSGRTMIWGRALNNMLDHPFTIVTGFGWYAYETSRLFSFAMHNYYLNILYNLGVIGVVLFLLVPVNAIRVVRLALARTGEEARAFLIAFVLGLLAFLVSIFFANFYEAWIFVWAFVGVSLRLAVSEMAAKHTAA